jgi:hypothetical protein
MTLVSLCGKIQNIEPQRITKFCTKGHKGKI